MKEKFITLLTFTSGLKNFGINFIRVAILVVFVWIGGLKYFHYEAGLKTVTLQADNYDLTDTINYLKGILRQCYGIIIIGFGQIFIETGQKKKNGTPNPSFFFPQEVDISGQQITSPFCHIEGTIGLLYDLPLLIINEEGVREEGIIKGGRFSVKTQNFNLDKIDDFFNDEIVNHQIAVWVGKVTDYYLFLNLKKV